MMFPLTTYLMKKQRTWRYAGDSHAFWPLQEHFFWDLLNANALCMMEMTYIWTEVYTALLGKYCFGFAHTYDDTPKPHHSPIAKFEANLKVSADYLFHYKRMCSLLLLFFWAEHDTKTWQSLTEFCPSIKKLKDHLWLWNVLFPHIYCIECSW